MLVTKLEKMSLTNSKMDGHAYSIMASHVEGNVQYLILTDPNSFQPEFYANDKTAVPFSGAAKCIGTGRFLVPWKVFQAECPVICMTRSARPGYEWVIKPIIKVDDWQSWIANNVKGSTNLNGINFTAASEVMYLGLNQQPRAVLEQYGYFYIYLLDGKNLPTDAHAEFVGGGNWVEQVYLRLYGLTPGQQYHVIPTNFPDTSKPKVAGSVSVKLCCRFLSTRLLLRSLNPTWLSTSSQMSRRLART